MSIFGGLRAAPFSTQTCRRLFSEAGPSRPLQLAAVRSQHRLFNTSTAADFLPAQPLRSPKWINSRSSRVRLPSANDGANSAIPTNHDRETGVRLDSETPPDSAAPPAAPPASSGSSGDDAGSSGSNSDSASPPPTPPPDPPSPPQTSISKHSVPEIYPQVLALPIARRPLFPGFYKAVVIRNPAVVAAIKEMMRRGQPYLGAFLLKDEHTDSDVITDINSVHPVGVFAQITSVFSANGGAAKDDDKEEGLTAVLYPHRRIRITDLVNTADSTAKVQVEPVEDVPIPEASAQELPTPPPSPTPEQNTQVVNPCACILTTPRSHRTDFIIQPWYRQRSCIITQFQS